MSRPATRPEPLAIFNMEPQAPDLLTRVHRESSCGFYGTFDSAALSTKGAEFIAKNSDGDEKLLQKTLHGLLALAEKDYANQASTGNDGLSVPDPVSCWLCIRMTLPTDYWVVPRWHQDGRMFDCTCPEPKTPHSKYGFTILGPSTRVVATNPEAHDILNSPSPTGEPWDQNDPNLELARALEKYPQVPIELGQMIRFSWGQEDSPIHSEPDSTDRHRVFVSILFGSEKELRDMCDFRGQVYGAWD